MQSWDSPELDWGIRKQEVVILISVSWTVILPVPLNEEFYNGFIPEFHGLGDIFFGAVSITISDWKLSMQRHKARYQATPQIGKCSY